MTHRALALTALPALALLSACGGSGETPAAANESLMLNDSGMAMDGLTGEAPPDTRMNTMGLEPMAPGMGNDMGAGGTGMGNDMGAGGTTMGNAM